MQFWNSEKEDGGIPACKGPSKGAGKHERKRCGNALNSNRQGDALVELARKVKGTMRRERKGLEGSRTHARPYHETMKLWLVAV